MPDAVTDRLEEVAQQPLRMQGDEGEVENPRLGDMIKADNYLAGKTAVALKSRGLWFTRIIAPSAIGGAPA